MCLLAISAFSLGKYEAKKTEHVVLRTRVRAALQMAEGSGEEAGELFRIATVFLSDLNALAACCK